MRSSFTQSLLHRSRVLATSSSSILFVRSEDTAFTLCVYYVLLCYLSFLLISSSGGCTSSLGRTPIERAMINPHSVWIDMRSSPLLEQAPIERARRRLRPALSTWHAQYKIVVLKMIKCDNCGPLSRWDQPDVAQFRCRFQAAAIPPGGK